MLFGDFEEDNFRKEAMGKDGTMTVISKVDSSTDDSKVQNNSSFELSAYIASE